MSRKDLTRYNLLAVGAIAAPMLLVGLGPNVIGAGPGLSLALGHKPGDGGTDAAITKHTVNEPKRQLAMNRVAALRGGAIAATPFRPEPVAVKPVVEAAPAEPAAEPAPLAKPDVVVKMIMRGGAGAGGSGGSAARALIGGKICTEGDGVGDGWTIQSIDAEARSVTFASSDGQTYTVNLK